MTNAYYFNCYHLIYSTLHNFNTFDILSKRCITTANIKNEKSIYHIKLPITAVQSQGLTWCRWPGWWTPKFSERSKLFQSRSFTPLFNMETWLSFCERIALESCHKICQFGGKLWESPGNCEKSIAPCKYFFTRIGVQSRV